VLEQLGLPPRDVLAVGDSLRTDIAGAVGVDLAACWVLDGIHGTELRASGGTFDTTRAETLARDAGVPAIATIPRFVW
jgi:ribonucleotide monophosphatase NagD (HAD superfamily)